MAFYIVLKNVLTMMVYLILGLLMVKSGKARTEHAKSVSTLLIYICGPCMIINAFQGMTCSSENNRSILSFFMVTLVLQIIYFLIFYLILRKRIDDPRYRILSIGGEMGNVGFLGLPLVTSLFPTIGIVAGYSSIYVMSMNLIVFTLGVYMITGDRKYISVRSMLLNPTSLAIFVAVPMYLLGITLPDTVGDSVALFGKMTTPLCMIVLGMRLASVHFMDLLKRPFAYVSCASKLLIFPIFCYLCVKPLPMFDEVFKTCILVLSAVPTAAVVLSLAEIHEQQQELAANVVLLSTILSVITIPVIMLIV